MITPNFFFILGLFSICIVIYIINEIALTIAYGWVSSKVNYVKSAMNQGLFVFDENDYYIIKLGEVRVKYTGASLISEFAIIPENKNQDGFRISRRSSIHRELKKLYNKHIG